MVKSRPGALKFSERKGFKEPQTAIQKEGMSEELRNSLWNVLDVMLWRSDDFVYAHHRTPGIESYSRVLWFDYFKLPIDSRPSRPHRVLAETRGYFFSCQWYEVYDFLEWTVDWVSESSNAHASRTLQAFVNTVLERELAGYRYIDGVFTDITDEQEIEVLERELADDGFPGVREHLRTALRLLSDRKNPDYRNSIKESISAVESMAKAVTKKEKATLRQALQELEKRGELHTALKEGWVKLYCYTSDEEGVRHAMLEEPNLTAADAKYFLLSCTSFINYLKSKL